MYDGPATMLPPHTADETGMYSEVPRFASAVAGAGHHLDNDNGYMDGPMLGAGGGGTAEDNGYLETSGMWEAPDQAGTQDTGYMDSVTRRDQPTDSGYLANVEITP